MGSDKPKAVRRALAYGAASVGLYVLLFLFARQILAVTTHGGAVSLLIVAITFVFSLVHGAFTGYFWEALGVRASRDRGR